MIQKNILKPLAIFLSFCLIFGMMSLLSSIDTSAQAPTEVFHTPTPDENGYVYHTVTEADFACYNIALKFNTTVAEIIRLNNLDADCTISVGRKLLMAVITATAAPPTATPDTSQPTTPPQDPQPTQPPVDYVPEPTAMLDTGKICIVLFHDTNGNGMRESGENYLYGGEVSINDRIGTVSRVGTTVAGDPEITTPLCFDQLPPGEYNLSIAVPDGFNSTTAKNHAMTINPGDTLTVDFGAQEATPEKTTQNAEAAPRSWLLFILGGVILVSGLGLLFYMIRSQR